MYKLYLLGCDLIENGGGIFAYNLNEKGKLSFEKEYKCNKPMFAVIDEDRLHVLLRQEFDENHSGYFSLDLNLENPSEMLDTQGVCACHLTVNKGTNYIVNYSSSNVVKNCKEISTHIGFGPHPKRQTKPHTHFVCFSPNKENVLCTDLGIDTLFVYNSNFEIISEAKVPDGYGIRHFVFSKDGKFIYAINELVPSISVFSYDNGQIKYLSTTPIKCSVETATAAAIRLSLNGKYLYASTRGENTLCVFEVDGEQIKLIQTTSCGGQGPRDIWLVEDKFLVVCNENSHNAVVFKLDNNLIGEILDEVHIQGVLCCLNK